MRKTAAALVAMMLVVLGTSVFAQEPKPTLVLTLDEAIAMALRQNPFHLATQEKVVQARSQVRQAVSGFLPSVNAQGTDTLDEKLFVLEFPSLIPGEPPQRISIDFTKDYQMALAFSLPLFAGGRLTAGLQAGQLQPPGQPGDRPPVRAGDDLRRQEGLLRLPPGPGVLRGRRRRPWPWPRSSGTTSRTSTRSAWPRSSTSSARRSRWPTSSPRRSGPGTASTWPSSA